MSHHNIKKKSRIWYLSHAEQIFSLKIYSLVFISMSHLILGGLLSTPAPTAPIVGIAFIVLFAIVGVMVGPDYDGMNAPALGNSKKAD